MCSRDVPCRASHRSRLGLAATLLLAFIALPACYLHHRLEDDAPRDASVDAARDAAVDAAPDAERRPPTRPFRCDDGSRPVSDADIDLLFVIDDSPSMAPKQARLARELPRMVDSLAFGDLDFDGVQDFPVPRSLRVGAITSSSSRLVLLRDGRTFIDFQPATDARGELTESTAFLVRRGSSGDTIEKPLSMLWGALHNVEFRRPGAILAVVLLSDEDDCSDEGCWELCRRNLDISSCEYPRMEMLGLPFWANVWRSRPDPGPAFLTVIAGAPTDLLGEDLDVLLRDPRMFVDEGPVSPSCRFTEGRVAAFPPRRLASFADMLGADANLESICAEDFSRVLAPLLRHIATEIVRQACSP